MSKTQRQTEALEERLQLVEVNYDERRELLQKLRYLELQAEVLAQHHLRFGEKS